MTIAIIPAMSAGKWTAYHLGPIDHKWEWLQTVEEVAHKLVEQAETYLQHLLTDPDTAYFYEANPSIDDFLADFASAQRLAQKAGWGGL